MDVICYSCGKGENPENTIEGIKHCQSVNSTWRIEMDVQLTKDNELVLFHDYDLERITGQKGRIDELDYGSLEKLNAAYNYKEDGRLIYRDFPLKIPKLETVFKQFKYAKLLLDIHTNKPEVVDIIIELIERYHMSSEVILVSEYDTIVKDLKAKRPKWVYGVPATQAKRMVYSSFVYMDNYFPIQEDILMLPKKKGIIPVLTKRVVNHAKNRGKKLWAWMLEGPVVKTINSRKELNEMRALGADGVFTECPNKLHLEWIDIKSK